MPLVVITDCDHGNIRPEEAVLQAAGVPYRLYQGQREDEVIAHGVDADVLILQYARITSRVMDALPKVRALVRYGVGYDTIDVDAATARGILVCNVPDYCVEEVSDHALALALAAWRRVPHYDRRIRSGAWSATEVRPVLRLHGRVMGVIGLGRIGGMLARKAAGVGMTVWAHDPYLVEWPAGVRRVELDELLAGADIVSLHVPLSAKTHHLIGERELRRMQPTAFLVNTARGGVVDSGALARALREGWIAGAGIDVLEQEPLPADSPLLSLPNAIFTPHAAWYSENSNVDLKRMVAEAAVASLRAERPGSVVNPEAYERPTLRAVSPLL